MSSFFGNFTHCDQIGQFIGLWASFLKPLAAINLPKYPTCLGNFCKGVIFLVKSIWCNFYRHLAIFFWSHCSPLQQMFKINGIISDPFGLMRVIERYFQLQGEAICCSCLTALIVSQHSRNQCDQMLK